MTEITVTLNRCQAESVRQDMLTFDYSVAVEECNELLSHFDPPLDEIVVAKDRVRDSEQVIEQIGWDEPIASDEIALTTNPDDLRTRVARQLGFVCDTTETLAKSMGKHGCGLIVLRDEVAKINALLALLEELGEAEDR